MTPTTKISESAGTAALAASPRALAAHRVLNATTVPYPERASIGELFERAAGRHPGRIAVVHRERRITYRELNGAANALAARLLAEGVRPGDTVAVAVARSPELITALLAVVKCGAAYLPVDPAWPDGRLNDLLERTGATVALSDRPAELGARLAPCRVLPPEGEDGPGADAPGRDGPAGNPGIPVPPDAIAYVNFTSGSTGRPKGVPIEHRSVARLVFGARYARLDADAVLLQLAPAHFDAATFEVWGALLHGGTCVLHPSAFVRLSELRRVLREHRVSVLFLTTALFNTVIDEAPETLAGVTTVLTGGEAHSLRHIAAALRRLGPDRLVSVYGPTEATTFATYHPVRELRPEETALPIGRPIQNTRAYLVEGGRLCEPGETGEVLLAGPGLSPGYLGLPRATAERFLTRLVDGVPERLYRTGDRAYLDEGGRLVFQGRLDDQVKINGHRIELGEVAHHLDRHPAVRQGYVTATDGAAGERRLVAFVVPLDGSCSPEGVREFLAARLPGYLVPAEIRLCTAFPLSATGKVDRRTLLSSLRDNGSDAQ
ncbi:amino acid adenylation domain-containing protein [Kitasatospora sp. NPDC004240]